MLTGRDTLLGSSRRSRQVKSSKNTIQQSHTQYSCRHKVVQATERAATVNALFVSSVQDADPEFSALSHLKQNQDHDSASLLHKIPIDNLSGSNSGSPLTDPSEEPTSTTSPQKIEPMTHLKQELHAKGTLDLIYWGPQERMLRVWTPPGFSATDPPCPLGWPVLYLNDGQNLFDDKLSFSGCSWRAAEAASELITNGKLPPFIIVGMDHSGKTRSLDYTPYKPGTGPGGFRKDAADWPGGGVDAYLDKVEQEVMPFVREKYGAASDPQLIAFGGSSFGGICTLMACIRRPGLFSAALIESPSLWLAEEKILSEDVADFEGAWPQRIFVGMGGREYSGIRKKEPGQEVFDSRLAGYVATLETALLAQGVKQEGLMTILEPEATHTESAWMNRLPHALSFLLSPWWNVLATQGKQNHLYCTVPRRLKAGQAASFLVNKSRSSSLSAAQGLKLIAGYNGWSEKVEVTMTNLPHSATGGQEGWCAAQLTVPANAHELCFALSDDKGEVWDSNGGSNFYIRISQQPPGVSKGPIPPLDPRSRSTSSSAPASSHQTLEEVAKRHTGQLYFSYPERMVAGQPAMLYMNRRNSEPFRECHNIKIHYGFNNWELGTQVANVTPTSLWRSEWADWWGVHINVPEKVEDMHFCFTDGQGNWDSNFGNNYAVSISTSKSDSEATPSVRMRSVASEEALDHAGGKLHVLNLAKRDSGDKISDRNAKWTEEKVVRVWTPPGYTREGGPKGGWPVLYMNDAQNKFECWLAHQGVSWRVGYTAAGLIAAGDVPPFVIVGIDNPGPMRSLNYLPYAPGSGVGGFRGDAARWPGGGVEQYMQRVIQEIMPMVTDKYNLATDPARVAFGGGSFGGVNALYASLHYSHVFGTVLAESPSLWIADGRFLEDMWSHNGMLPERIFMGCGTREYSATRDHERDDVDALLLHYYQEAARALEAKGMNSGNGRLRFLIEEGAGHHELAWQWRLTGALKFLLGPWKEELY